MVLASISIISSSTSFPSISNSTTDYSPPSTSTPFRTRITKTLFTFPTRTTKSPFSFSSTHSSLSPQNAIFRASYSENGSPEQFLNNNSIADFMRFKRGGDGGSGQLQTAVVSYKKNFPWSLLNPFLQVDLVSTIHIADEEYFLALQKELESYDCVLYEMVASRESLENRRNPIATKRFKGSRSNRGFNILGFIQRQMANILRLDFQLDCVDYQAANWYHADLDFETFKLLQVPICVLFLLNSTWSQIVRAILNKTIEDLQFFESNK